MKLDQKSFTQQSLKCKPLLPWLQHFHTNKLYNLLSLSKSTCLPGIKFQCQSYKSKLLKKQVGQVVCQGVCQVLSLTIQMKLSFLCLFLDLSCLSPEKVELTVKSKKETNGRVKMG